MLRNWVFRLGANPDKSWRQFKQGLGLFVAGAALILLGVRGNALWQVPGLLLLAPGVVLAAKGYVGLFANRFAQTLKRLRPDDDADNQDSPPR